MPTYSLSTRNQFRSPSGAVGEAPDGPGGIAVLRDDVDNFLGVGGAEYCANAAALAAIPSSRLFKGKQAYRADLDTVFRYVGVGGTALGSTDSTSKWQAWETPPTPVTPTWSSGITAGTVFTSAIGWWGITAGRTWFDVNLIASAAGWISNNEMNFILPSSVATQMSTGTGWFQPGGAPGQGLMVPLLAYSTGTPGLSSSALRVRVPRIGGNTVPANPTLSFPYTAFGAGVAADQMSFSFSAPSARVA